MAFFSRGKSCLQSNVPAPPLMEPVQRGVDLSRIWLTYKARINSERRYRRYALASHLALSWYAFLSIGFSIYQDDVANKIGISSANKLSLITSILTFGLSLIIYGFKFEDSANIFRDCYLRLQSIYQSGSDGQKKLNAYQDLLDHYPNHSKNDYEDVLFDAWRAGDRLENSKGVIPIPNRIIVQGYFRKAVWYFLICVVFMAPLIAIKLL